MPVASPETPDLPHAQAGKLFAMWIHRLRLNDWDIRWRVVRRDELPTDRAGCCDSLAMKKIANIRVLHPDEGDSAWLDPYDIELTIVHELLHLHFAPWALLFEEGDQANLFLEQTVHTLSSTLIAADRGNRHWRNFPELCGVQDPRPMVR